MIRNCRMISFKRISSNYGALTAIEGGVDPGFEIRRVYYTTDVPVNVTRGFHAHRKLEQVLLCLNGEIKIRIKTPYEEEVVKLKNDSVGLYIGNMVWREIFDYTPNAVLMVLASEHYMESDYYRDYDTYESAARLYFKEENNQ